MRLDTRSTWRSTAMTGMPKQNASTMEAVFLPIPGIVTSASARASRAGMDAEEREACSRRAASRIVGRSGAWRRGAFCVREAARAG